MNEALREVVERECPDWEIVEPWPPEKWIEALEDRAGVTGYWSADLEDNIEFKVNDLDSQRITRSLASPTDADIRAWIENSGFGEFPDENQKSQLINLMKFHDALRIDLAILRVSLRHCGTLESGRICLALSTDTSESTIDLRPVDVSWETFRDDTFGPMW